MSAVKALQQWCRVQCDGYRDVSITNMTTSFRDGLAFCALIHRHRPDLLNFDLLKKDDVYENNKLAFRVAEEELEIPALLDAEDMVALRVPDRLSILTYVSQYYNYFHGRSPIGGMAGVKRPAEVSKEEKSGKKNQAVVSKVFPSSKPATENNPPPPARPSLATKKEVLDETSRKAGTLNNKCVSCQKHVHLVQRQLVDGKLYHRNCGKSLLNANSPLRDLSPNTSVSRYTPHSEPIKDKTPTPFPSKVASTWLATKTERSSPPGSVSGAPPPWKSALASPLSGRGSQPSTDPPPATATNNRLGAALQTTSDPAFTTRPTAGPLGTSDRTPTATTTSIATQPVPAPRASTTALKTQQAKLRFLQKGAESPAAEKERKTPLKDVITSGVLQDVYTPGVRRGPAVSVVVSDDGVGGKGDACTSGSSGLGVGAKAKGSPSVGAASQESSNAVSKTQAAAAFITKKLSEESSNKKIKSVWTRVEFRKTEKPSDAETQKKDTEVVPRRVKLKVNPALLDDLRTPSEVPKPDSTPTAAFRSGPGSSPSNEWLSRPPGAASPKDSGSDNSECPAEWRSKLKPVSKNAKPAGPKSSPVPSAATEAESPARPWEAGAGKPQASEAKPPPSLTSSRSPKPGIRGFQNGSGSPHVNGSKPEPRATKNKPDYIPKEQILSELDEIEDSLNELEKRGVELEKRLRHSEAEGEDDARADELMIEWFNLIRNKQVAMRRESELVYIAKTQDLEEQQPSVEQELRRLMEKPEYLKTEWDRRKEKELMDKLVEIVNDRNAIVEGLDDDRLREEEEDEQLNKMMMNFDIKKDKSKKKSPMSKLFNWGNKKEG